MLELRPDSAYLLCPWPYNVGRSVPEMLRLMEALKALDEGQGFAPEGWVLGLPLLAPPSDGSILIDQEVGWYCRRLP